MFSTSLQLTCDTCSICVGQAHAPVYTAGIVKCHKCSAGLGTLITGWHFGAVYGDEYLISLDEDEV